MATTNDGFTLSDLTRYGRSGVKVLAIGLVVLMVGRFSLNFAVSVWKALNPPPPPPPTMGFGYLPEIEFPVVAEDEVPSEFILEVASGSFPRMPDRAKVFAIPQASIQLFNEETAREIAAQLGFVFQPEAIGLTGYRFTKSTPIDATLQIDIVTFQTTITSDYLSRPELLLNDQLPQGPAAIQQLKSYLSAADLLPEDMATVSGNFKYLKALGGDIEPALSYSDADFVEVDLHRTPVDGAYRMFTPLGRVGTVNAIIAGGLPPRDSVVELRYNYFPVDYLSVETYPLRPVADAWQVLSGGGGYVVNPNALSSPVIRSVELGYFDDFSEQAYLQPIYVFFGDDGFMGYVPAVAPQVVGTPTTPSPAL